MQVRKWLIISIFSILLILFVYPSAFIYPKDILPDNNDTRLIAYIIGQVQNNLIEHKPLYSGTFFAPEKDTLTYSDLFLTTSIITLPFRALTNHPVLIFNVALITNFLLTIISSYLLFNYLFKDHWVTLLATILFNFTGFHLSYLPHLQIFSLWLTILTIYFYLRYQDTDKNIFLTLVLLSSTAQLAESIFTFYLIFFACFCLFWRKKEQFLKILIQFIFILPLWISLLFPYLQLHLQFPEATRPIRDAAAFSLGLDEIFTKYHSRTVITLFITTLVIESLFQKAWQSRLNRKVVIPATEPESRISGFYLYRFRVKPGMTLKKYLTQFLWRGPKRHIFDPWKYILFFSLIMSLGPVLKIFGKNLRIFSFPTPLPYALFYYLFPGFTGFRTPSRFILLALLAAVIIIGYKLVPIFKNLAAKTKFTFILLILSFLFLEADLPLKGYPVNINMHPVYQEVKNLPSDDIILELPIKLWNMPDHEIESVRSLYSLFHKHRRLGGFSGFATKDWIDMVENINAYGLNPEIIFKLKSLGVTHVIENNQLRKI